MNNQIQEVLKLFVNQILFGKPNNSVFNFGKTELSKEFNNILFNNHKSTDSKSLEDFLGIQINITLNDFNEEKRCYVIHNILKDETFIKGMFILNLIDNNITSEDNPLLFNQKFESDIEDYIMEGKVNFYILTYFKLYFEDLFYYKFSITNFITDDEYLNICNHFTKEKCLVNLY